MSAAAPKIDVDTESSTKILETREWTKSKSEATPEGTTIKCTTILRIVTETEHAVTVKIPSVRSLENTKQVLAQDARR